jgi:hypothetical protein
MKRALIAYAIASVLCGAGAFAVVASAAEPPRAELDGFACHRAADALDRWITVTAVMRPVPGTERMALRFDLQRIAAHSGSFVNVRGGDLGQWRYPSNPPTLGQSPNDVWKLTKDVVNLQAPAVYRFHVTFRWTGTGGRVLDRAVRLSARCSEPG